MIHLLDLSISLFRLNIIIVWEFLLYIVKSQFGVGLYWNHFVALFNGEALILPRRVRLVLYFLCNCKAYET